MFDLLLIICAAGVLSITGSLSQFEEQSLSGVQNIFGFQRESWLFKVAELSHQDLTWEEWGVPGIKTGRSSGMCFLGIQGGGEEFRA